MKLFILCFISLSALVEACFSAGAQTVTNCQLPGIVCFSEILTNPPQQLYVARVDLTNSRLHLRVAPGGPDPDTSGPWETTLMEPTRIADREHFALVVNGDFFLARNVRDAEGAKAGYRASQWARPVGPAMTDGQTWSTSTNARPCLVIHKDQKVTIESLASPGADDWEVIGGGPILLQAGKVVVPRPRPNPKKPHSFSGRNPRTVVGLDASGTRLTLLIVDGRKSGVAAGMTFDELADEMLRLGCTEAINLDGGGSSVMAVRDAGTRSMKMLNQPTDGHERAVADVLGIVLDK
jgi:exopolysaccharide biosynthesis protein